MKRHLLIALLLAAVPAFAEEKSFTLDAAHTTVRFTLGDVLHTVHGTFRAKQGAMKVDTSDGKASGEFVVDAASGDSGSHARDSRMNKNILETAKYPMIVFRPDRVAGAMNGPGPYKLQVHGTFSIHGADHEITLPVEARLSDGRWIATTHFTVPYVKWGMKNPSTFMLRVNETVDVDIEAAGQ